MLRAASAASAMRHFSTAEPAIAKILRRTRIIGRPRPPFMTGKRRRGTRRGGSAQSRLVGLSSRRRKELRCSGRLDALTAARPCNLQGSWEDASRPVAASALNPAAPALASHLLQLTSGCCDLPKEASIITADASSRRRVAASAGLRPSRKRKRRTPRRIIEICTNVRFAWRNRISCLAIAAAS